MKIATDFRSKLVDGLLTTAVLLLIWITLALLLLPIRNFGMPSLLVYCLVLIGLGFFCLEQALNGKLAETTRAWYGIVGGVFVWVAVLVSAQFGLSAIHPGNGDILWLIAALFSASLWWKIFPLGVKFWMQVILMSWGGQILLSIQRYLATITPLISYTIQAIGYASICAILGVLYYLFARTQTRIQRMWAALWIWFLITMIISIFHGDIF